MAGIMGTAAQWARLQVGLDKLKRHYGFRIFHATDFKHRDHEFSGWSPAKCLALINDLSELTGKQLMHGAVLTVNNMEYAAHYRNRDGPSKLRLDSCYGLSFRLCLMHMVGEVVRRFGHHKRMDQIRLNIVLESGHKNSGDAVRVFHEEMKGLQEIGCDLLTDIMLADKDQCDLLMVADFLAHTTFMRGDRWAPDAADGGISPRKEKATLMHLGFDPGGLAKYKGALVERWGMRRASSAVSRP